MNRYNVTINGKTREVTLTSRKGASAVFSIDGETYEVQGEPILTQNGGPNRVLTSPMPKTATKSVANLNSIVAPMPGFIVNILVKVGDKVSAGQKVLLMEAMKMENAISAARDGVVKEILVKKAEEVKGGQVLVTLS